MSEQSQAEQSASVTRYRMTDSSCGWRYFAVADGEWVKHEDYAALEAQLAEAKAKGAQCVRQLEAETRRAEEAERAAERLAQDLANCISGKEEAQRAVEVMRSGLEKIAEHKDCGYGYYHGGDPRDFTPDSESCTPEELAAHEAACKAFDDADKAGTPMKLELDGSGWIAPGIHVLKSNYGIGTYMYPSECAEMAAAAIERARGGNYGE